MVLKNLKIEILKAFISRTPGGKNHLQQMYRRLSHNERLAQNMNHPDKY